MPPGAPASLPTPRPSYEGYQGRELWLRGIATPMVGVFRPARPDGRAVLVIPGGAYSFNSVSNEGIDVARVLNPRGITVFCVHPGGPRLVGTEAIRSAFEQMFGNGSIHATPARVRKVESLGSSVHNVLERIEVLTTEGPRLAFVLATNVYHKTAQGWRMVAHHASPGTVQEPSDTRDAPQLLH